MAYITVGTENSADIELFYTDQGSGQPVVLIHGFPLNGESWGKQQAALLDAGYRVIAYDRRGFGASTKTGSGYDFDTFAADLTRSWTTSTSTTPCSSASRWAPARSRATSRATAASASRRRPSSRRSSRTCSRPTTTRTARGRRSSSTASRPPSREDRYAFLTGFFKDFYNLDENLGSRISQEALDAQRADREPAGNAAIAAAPLTWPTDFRADIPNIDVPALIVHGTADNILPIDVTGRRFTKLLPDATYVEIEGAPHGMLWTHGDEVNEALLAFLATSPLTATAWRRETERVAPVCDAHAVSRRAGAQSCSGRRARSPATASGTSSTSAATTIAAMPIDLVARLAGQPADGEPRSPQAERDSRGDAPAARPRDAESDHRDRGEDGQTPGGCGIPP